MANQRIRRSLVVAASVALVAAASAGAFLLGGTARAQGETADFAIDKTADADTVDVGANLTYTLVVTNNGPDASTAQVLDTLPPTATVVSISDTDNCTQNGTVVTCATPELADGDTYTVQIVVTPTVPGELMNSAFVGQLLVLDPDPSNNGDVVFTTVNGGGGGAQADLAVEKSADPDPAIQGEDLTYTITVTNNGPDTVTAQVADLLPITDVTFVSASDQCTPPQGPFVQCTVPDLASGSTVALQIVVQPTNQAPLVNTVTVNGGLTTLDPDPTNNVDIIVTQVELPSSASPTPTETSPSPSGSTTNPPTGTPIGGVDTGAGGTASNALPYVPLVLLIAGVGGALLLLRRRLRA